MGIKDEAEKTNKPITVRYPDGSMVRFGRLEDMDRTFDLEFWQSRSSMERAQAAWELALHYHQKQGQSLNELRLQRSISRFQRIEG